ncbi:TetM/TetW/TetO/TetS family tetracycline resistance ribosomal protection protein [Clostridium sp.]|uniref:TetM/TetW/TetO/TetS family tetracycline resistance ribosomal protection protein n=1 Tax=Clostridium sp. TaxID=1506 RepID=UPI001ED6F705|nr:TetM/TetW/TetO/TetS family tetracycline resistance ribosomal protection protein [Clostridium sp.]MBS5883917.1 TetM/TetW/TetO/TetS family tetracycline resistance ribosomal protection protein [Clostridium sp.]
MKKTIGILAHVDAGKTTFSEQILYHTKSIRNRGRVDHKNSFLDTHDIEKERGITVFSEQATFQIGSSTYYLIDTPGHIDFSTEMERALSILDYAILLISGVEGIQGHTETIWNLLRKYNIPTFIFINKMDRTGADLERTLEEINENLTKDICHIDSIHGMSEELIEFISERNEDLLERYFNGDYEETIWINELKKLIKENKVFPCLSGSALQDEGIDNFLNIFNELTYTNYDEGDEFSGRVHKIRYDNNGTRITFIKAISGSLKVRDEVTYGTLDEEIAEKVSSIRFYNGSKFTTVEKISAGDIFAVTGITKAMPGEGIGKNRENIQFNMIPTLMSKVIFDKSYNVKEVLGYFRILESEDPALNIIWNETHQEIQVSIMGKIQLEVLKEVALNRFNLKIEFGPCEIMYKETIDSKTYGYGHFEPLKHYAEVHLKMELNKRGEGITFENKCHADDLTTGNQNLIKTHIFERNHHGLLTGSPITDMKITLLTGRAHNKHTEGGDFREATFRAIRQGLEKANNILLEPFYKFKIDVELDYMGKVISDIQRLNGSFDPPETKLNKVSITGRGPVATFMDYSSEILTFTKGKGSISLIFDGYDVCHNTEEAIEKIGYDKNADIEYSSSSIFCSKGQGFVVPWDKVEEYIHCEVKE